LKALRPVWYGQVEHVTGKLAAAAEGGRPLAEVSVYGNLFWRLYSCELILVEDEGVESAMIDFGKDLQAWEGAPSGKASPEVVASMRRHAAKLRDLFKDPTRVSPRQ
jgi:hypothetical protein